MLESKRKNCLEIFINSINLLKEGLITSRKPSVIIPYRGPEVQEGTTDIFLYLRPETNGVNVEKCIFRVLHNVPLYKEKVSLVYLANLPGEFIVENQVIKKHYAVRTHFAQKGKAGMTEGMRRHFQVFFGIPWEKAKILGAYEALEEFHLTESQLFDLWVPPYDILISCGQIIKRKEDIFIINYDIPALLQKNNADTDIAAMILRFKLDTTRIRTCLEEIRQSLVLDGILDPMKPPARVFHFSKSPFDLIQDAMGHLTDQEGKLMGWQVSSFGRYLAEKGMRDETVENLIRFPIVQFEVKGVGIIEENIHVATADFSYEEAWQKFATSVGQISWEES